MGKIRASLVAVMNSEETNSTYYRIAKYLLQNNYIVNHVSMDDVAKNCYCAKSTVSRFCRQIGYENYYELNQDLYTSTTKSQDKYDKYLLDDFENTKDIFFKDLINSILDAKNSITKKSVFTLVSLIKEYNEIGIFGNLQSQTIAQKFQNDMGLSRKIITASLLPEHQKTYIKEADQQTLIIIVSFSGQYFRQFINLHHFNKENKPHFILITCNEKMKNSKLYDDIIYLSCPDNYASRAHIMSFYLNMVAIEYANTK